MDSPVSPKRRNLVSARVPSHFKRSLHFLLLLYTTSWKTLNLPLKKKPASFSGSGTEMPFVILGDEACPLETINEAFREKGSVM